MARSRTPSSPRANARARGQRNTRASTTPLDGGLVIHRSPEAERVESLRRDHDKLLRDIAKKKAAVEAIVQLASEVSQQLAQRLGPLKLNYDELVAEIGRLFAQLLGSASQLGRRDKARIRSAYFEVFAELGIDLSEHEERPDVHPASSAEDDHSAEAERGSGRRARGASAVGANPEEDWGDAGYSANKPSETHASTLRALFRRLAVALHPDKVQGEQEKAERTSWMKDVTRAYESGDVARLVEIERTLLAQAPIADDPDALRRQELELVAAIKELRRQLRGLTEEHKLVRDSMPIPLDLRAKSKMQEQVDEEIYLLLSNAELELVELRRLQQHLQRFTANKITLRDFLVGPGARSEPRVVAVDELMEEFMRDFLGFAPAARRRSPSRPARR